MPLTKSRSSQLGLLSLAEAARELGVNPDTVRNWINRIPQFPRPVVINGRPYLRTAELTSWINAQPRSGCGKEAAQ